MQNRDNVIIRYSGNGRKSDKKQNNSKDKASKTNNFEADYEFKRLRQIRALSVLLFFFALLLFLSLISYTPADEAYTGISIKDLIYAIAGDEAFKIHTESVQNWLGLAGAMMSNALFNYTIGYTTVFLPVFIIIAAKNLFFRYNINERTIKMFIVYLSLSICLSILLATISSSGIFNEIPKEWYGVVGQFISSFAVRFLGTAGAIVASVAGIIFILIIGTNINIDNIIKLSKKLKDRIPVLYKKFVNIFSATWGFINKYISRNKKAQKIDNIEPDSPVESSIGEPEIPPTESIEPVKIIRRNLNISINRNVIEEGKAFEPQYEFDIPNPIKQSIFPVEEQSNIEPAPTKESSKEKNNLPSAIISYKKRVRFDTPSKEDTSKNSIEILDENKTHSQSENAIIIENPPINDIIPKENVFESESELNTYNEEYQNDGNTFEIEDEIQETDLIEELHDEAILDNDNVEFSEIRNDSKKLIVTVNEPIIHSNNEMSNQSSPICATLYDEDINYQPPPYSFLQEEDDTADIDEAELEQNAKILQEKLETFKISIENLSVTPGPVVTQYEFTPAAGIKISRIESLADDLAMALKARGIRIIAPIPGKGTVGIEIPNQKPSIVRFSSVIRSLKFSESSAKLPLALGKTISGEVFISDLSKMPHLLIAGSTGSGKSVGINTILASLIYKIHPRDLKFVIIDPKKVELNQYAILANHFLASSPDIDDTIITNPKDAVIILNAAVAEMEKRYDILAGVGQRNISEYNKKVLDGNLKHTKDILHRPMPYIVVIIDELADLMMTASKEIEEPITRLAQMARAVGIHLVVATQRPSVDVITGIIKANFPARLSYLVAQKVDSRTILDVMGAEQLLGNGDMLFLPNGSPKPIRLQNSFISTDEVDELCNFIGNQKGYSQPYMLPSLVEKKSGLSNGFNFDRDPLFEEAARLVIRHQQGSASLIQRRLKVGYARAGRIVDELESAGIIGPYEGSKARQVLMESESELEAVL